MAKARPKTGEARETHQPLKIDRLPESVHDAILALRNGFGLTWKLLEERSAKQYSSKWKEDGGGFIDWESLPLEVLELFPEMRLPRVTLHRWYDLRVAQAREEVLQDGDTAQQFIEKLGELKIEGMNDAVMHAMTREVFGLIQSTATGDRVALVKALNNTSLVLMRLQRVQLQQQKVQAEERKITLLEQREKLAIQKLENETERLAKKANSGQPITAEDLAEVRKKTFGF